MKKVKKLVTIKIERNVIVEHVMDKINELRNRLKTKDIDVRITSDTVLLGGITIVIIDPYYIDRMTGCSAYRSLLSNIGLKMKNFEFTVAYDTFNVAALADFCEHYSVDMNLDDLKLKVLFNNKNTDLRYTPILSLGVFSNWLNHFPDKVNAIYQYSNNEGVIDFTNLFKYTIHGSDKILLQLSEDVINKPFMDVIAVSDIIMYKDMGNNDIYIYRALKIEPEVWGSKFPTDNTFPQYVDKVLQIGLDQ